VGSRQLVFEPRSGPPRPGAGAGTGVERDDSASWRSVALSAPGPARGAAGYRSHCRVGLVKQSCRAGRTGLGGQRSRRDDAQAAGQAAARWPAAAWVCSREKRKTHILSVLSSSRLAARALGGPAAYFAGLLVNAHCAVQSASRAAGHVPLSSRRSPQRRALITTLAALITAQAPQRSGEAQIASGLPALPGPA
jgi:hypothetical protein